MLSYRQVVLTGKKRNFVPLTGMSPVKAAVRLPWSGVWSSSSREGLTEACTLGHGWGLLYFLALWGVLWA